MIEKLQHVRNPLTIIAIFAVLSEISGTVVLPFLNAQNQTVFMWFLILFPICLVVLFFITLNFNHKVLYAPSDFRNEEHFLRLFSKLTPAEKVEKVEQEIEDAIETSRPEASDDRPAESSKYRQLVRRDVRASYLLAETLVLDKLAIEYGLEVNREVALRTSTHQYIFDGVLSNVQKHYAVEVKYFAREMNVGSILRSLNKIRETIKGLSRAARKDFTVILAVVTDDPNATSGRIRQRIQDEVKTFECSVEIREYQLEQLERELGYV